MSLHSSTARPKRTMPSFTAIFFLLVFLLSAFLLLSPSPPCLPMASPSPAPWSGDLLTADFSWNSLPFSSGDLPPPFPLRIAVFSRKWPFSSSSSPGGMERHALTLHSALSLRGHDIHIFTAHTNSTIEHPRIRIRLHLLRRWRSDEAFSIFQSHHSAAPFDVVHTESVALFHRYARLLPNLAVSWHGISLESLYSSIYQSLSLPSPSLNRSLSSALPTLLSEIRFFGSYAHHVAISHSAAEILRDVYQIPRHRVHVILNGVDDHDFRPDSTLGNAFRADIGLPDSTAFVMGVAGRLVKDKGHPLLFQAFANLTSRFPDLHLVVAGSGPWEQRYRELGPNAVVLGALPPQKLRAFYNAIDLFVNPTLRPQGLDLTLMEAMKCGTPVMATRFPSIKGSVVVREEFGFLFSPNAAALEEAIERAVLEGKERMAERGRACREYAKDMFAARKMALAYERLFLCIKNPSFCQYPLEFD